MFGIAVSIHRGVMWRVVDLHYYDATTFGMALRSQLAMALSLPVGNYRHSTTKLHGRSHDAGAAASTAQTYVLDELACMRQVFRPRARMQAGTHSPNAWQCCGCCWVQGPAQMQRHRTNSNMLSVTSPSERQSRQKGQTKVAREADRSTCCIDSILPASAAALPAADRRTHAANRPTVAHSGAIRSLYEISWLLRQRCRTKQLRNAETFAPHSTPV